MAGNVYQFRVPGGAVGRFLAVLLGLLLAALAFFMFAFVAVAALLFAAVGLVRIWWLGRSRAPRRPPDVLTVEYTVEPSESAPPEPALPPAGHRS